MNWNRIIAVLLAGVLVSGCLSVMLRVRCTHGDFVIEKCYAYPRIKREK